MLSEVATALNGVHLYNGCLRRFSVLSQFAEPELTKKQHNPHSSVSVLAMRFGLTRHVSISISTCVRGGGGEGNSYEKEIVKLCWDILQKL